jgi:hypothetical protein
MAVGPSRLVVVLQQPVEFRRAIVGGEPGRVTEPVSPADEIIVYPGEVRRNVVESFFSDGAGLQIERPAVHPGEVRPAAIDITRRVRGGFRSFQDVGGLHSAGCEDDFVTGLEGVSGMKDEARRSGEPFHVRPCAVARHYAKSSASPGLPGDNRFTLSHALETEGHGQVHEDGVVFSDREIVHHDRHIKLYRHRAQQLAFR